MGPAIPGGFADGLRVVVTSGQYAGDSGEVINREPDLRPGSVWVNLVTAGIHLVPDYRLIPDSTATSSEPDRPATLSSDPAMPG
ncbi:MAG: hypothetical protein GEV28_38085 [Actinophytocola sp.]|uniref:hypothetical protein n=1 Tax=Actinophytocola sp. TaxID=1872138 RepID=UPI0013292888|nr:hypothetical protein [Actinophytocola sp.]MPZ85880.1 hypothetical protein [Actinophytocola sp.]